jgi:cytochrome b561
MSLTNTRAGNGAPSIAFHWLMLVLLAAVCALMEFKSIFPKGSAQRAAMATWHYTLGMSVFGLAWIRLALRLLGTAPAIEPAPPPWQTALSKAVQGSLYLLMIGLPLLGWLTLSARGEVTPFFGVELPALIGKSETLGRTFKEVHETLATVGYFLIGLHAAAALYHHYARRDNTLRLMALRR